MIIRLMQPYQRSIFTVQDLRMVAKSLNLPTKNDENLKLMMAHNDF